MQARSTLALSALVLALAAASCTDKPAGAGPAASAAPAAAEPSAVASASPSGKVDDDQETKKRRYPEPMVYVDGEAVAGLRFLELPPKLKTHWVKTSDDWVPARRFSVADYIEALGVDLSKVKQVHFIGGRNRHSIVEGAEVARKRDKFMFSFTQGERGKPRMHYPLDGMEVNTQIDIIGTMVIYQNRTPPKYDGLKKYTYFEEGQPIQGIPYATDERTGGTRVYVDGKLVGAIKRKTLPNAVAIPGTTEQGLTRFGFRAYLDHIGIGAEKIQGMELVSGDDVAATYDAKAYAEKSAGMVFTLPKRSRGRIQVMDLPEELSKLDAILVYEKSPVPDRVAQRATPGSPAAQVKSASTKKKPMIP
jgi:hypothetical protein